MAKVAKGKENIWLTGTQRQMIFVVEIFADHMFEIVLMFVVWFGIYYLKCNGSNWYDNI